MNDKWICEWKDGDHFCGVALINNVTKGVTDKGLTYLNITFQDKTGTIEGKKWDATDQDVEILVGGTFVEVDGVVNLYKNALQFKVNSINKLSDLTNIDVSRFQKVSPFPLDEMKSKLDKYLHSFKDKDVELVTNKVISHFYDKYIMFPAAVRVHHDFQSGILHHSLVMADLAEEVSRIYPQVDRDLLVAGALMHDIGKTIEYENPLTPSVTVEGKLTGHISIMYAEFKKIVSELNIQSEVPLLLEHMILSHHGTHEFGSPVLPLTREALLLTLIDQIDSKMMILDKAYQGVKPGTFTSKIWALDDSFFYKPKDR